MNIEKSLQSKKEYKIKATFVSLEIPKSDISVEFEGESILHFIQWGGDQLWRLHITDAQKSNIDFLFEELALLREEKPDGGWKNDYTRFYEFYKDGKVVARIGFDSKK